MIPFIVGVVLSSIWWYHKIARLRKDIDSLESAVADMLIESLSPEQRAELSQGPGK